MADPLKPCVRCDCPKMCSLFGCYWEFRDLLGKAKTEWDEAKRIREEEDARLDDPKHGQADAINKELSRKR